MHAAQPSFLLRRATKSVDPSAVADHSLELSTVQIAKWDEQRENNNFLPRSSLSSCYLLLYTPSLQCEHKHFICISRADSGAMRDSEKLSSRGLILDAMFMWVLRRGDGTRYGPSLRLQAPFNARLHESEDMILLCCCDLQTNCDLGSV